MGKRFCRLRQGVRELARIGEQGWRVSHQPGFWQWISPQSEDLGEEGWSPSRGEHLESSADGVLLVLPPTLLQASY